MPRDLRTPGERLESVDRVRQALLRLLALIADVDGDDLEAFEGAIVDPNQELPPRPARRPIVPLPQVDRPRRARSNGVHVRRDRARGARAPMGARDRRRPRRNVLPGYRRTHCPQYIARGPDGGGSYPGVVKHADCRDGALDARRITFYARARPERRPAPRHIHAGQRSKCNEWRELVSEPKSRSGSQRRSSGRASSLGKRRGDLVSHGRPRLAFRCAAHHIVDLATQCRRPLSS